MARGKILIIEDDRDIVDLLEYNLKEEDFTVCRAGDGKDGLAMSRREQPDLIILDIMMPVLDGFEVCRALKGDPVTSPIPIIILSARSQETDKIVGLELGADDYVTKPFSPREFVARVRAILRRNKTSFLPERMTRGCLEIDPQRHQVWVEGEEIALTSTEFKLLECLAQRPGVVLSRDQILDAVSGYDAVVSDRTVDAHIKSLRRKLAAAKAYIETVRGVGYRFKDV